jgi:hypothetical protein
MTAQTTTHWIQIEHLQKRKQMVHNKDQRIWMKGIFIYFRLSSCSPLDVSSIRLSLHIFVSTLMYLWLWSISCLLCWLLYWLYSAQTTTHWIQIEHLRKRKQMVHNKDQRIWMKTGSTCLGRDNHCITAQVTEMNIFYTRTASADRD